MSEIIARLRALQEIDEKRARAQREGQRIPREQQAKLAEVEAFRLRLERGREEVKRMRAEEKNLELEIKAKDERIEKLKLQANSARDSSTLLATNHQIQTLKDESSKLEDRALGLVERIGELEKESEKHARDLARIQEEYDAFAANCAAELSRSTEALAVLDGERAELASAIPDEVLETYGSLLETREGVAVSAVDGDSCSGCGAGVLPNDMMKLRAGKDLVRCKSCLRILAIAT